MHHTQVNYQKIYEKLGYLFYAIAAADNTVAAGEADHLRDLVKKIWLPVEHSTDEFGTDAAYYIDISFEYLLNEGIDPEEAFQVFSDYYEEHYAAFSEVINKNIKITAEAIAHAVKGRNKKESAILKRLGKILVHQQRHVQR